jgi:hypothetical protein
MIDHPTAQRLLATALDFPIEPVDRDALDEHLQSCPACRAYATGLRADAAVLREVDLGPVPVAVRANVAIAAERHGRGGAVGRWVVLVGVGALLLVALGGGAIGGGGSGRGGVGADATASPGAADLQVAWQTDVVTLTATDFSIRVGDKTFRGVSDVELHSDPGDATYRTLEATWREHGVEMRMNLYFGGDARSWWVDEIRVYDGTADPKWLSARGPLFRTPNGASWSGDQDISLTGEGGGGQPATVHLAGLMLASRPFDGITEPIGGGVALPENARPFGEGGDLRCSGILQMTPVQAEATLLGLGYRLSWRLERTTGQNTSFSEIMAHAPVGIIIGEPLAGSSGELIVFTAPPGDPLAIPVPFPADCPRSDPNATPPPPGP